MVAHLWLGSALGLALVAFSSGTNAAGIANGQLLRGADRGVFTGAKVQTIEDSDQRDDGGGHDRGGGRDHDGHDHGGDHDHDDDHDDNGHRPVSEHDFRAAL